MVHGTLAKSVDATEFNEFQLVHALITQSLKGLANDNATTSSSVDVNDNQVTKSTSPSATQTCNNSFLKSICQTINDLNSRDQQRLLPRSIRDIISHLRNTQEQRVPCTTASTKTADIPRRREKKATFQKQPSATDTNLPQRNDEAQNEIQQFLQNSNVHNKVLHFERCANTGQVEESLCGTCKKAMPPSKDAATPTSSKPFTGSCAETCPGGTYYRPATQSPGTGQRHPSPEKEEIKFPQPPKLTGRNLKRTPSEKFQQMRRKVQKLMTPSSPSNLDDGEGHGMSAPMDEATFLQSIQIPNPAFKRQESDCQECDLLRLPDHALCNIFSLLDTRTLGALKCVCRDFNFVIVNYDVRSTDSRWTTNERYLDDPCKQCRRQFTRGDTSMCRFHPKRFYSDLPYGRSYWMCCHQLLRNAPGCKEGLHDNRWYVAEEPFIFK